MKEKGKMHKRKRVGERKDGEERYLKYRGEKENGLLVTTEQ